MFIERCLAVTLYHIMIADIKKDNNELYVMSLIQENLNISDEMLKFDIKAIPLTVALCGLSKEPYEHKLYCWELMETMAKADGVVTLREQELLKFIYKELFSSNEQPMLIKQLENNLNEFKQQLNSNLEQNAQAVLADNTLGLMKGSMIVISLRKCGELAKNMFNKHIPLLGLSNNEFEQIIDDAVSSTIKRYTKL